VKLVLTSKERVNRRPKPGKGKFGRVKANEPLMRLREVEVIERRVETMMIGSTGILSLLRYVRTPGPRSTKGTHPERISAMEN
jgi:hypothetical protein